MLERMARRADELDVVPHGGHLAREELVETRVGEPFDQFAFRAHALLARREPLQPLAQQIEHAAKALAHADRPAHGRAVDAEHRFDFLEEGHRLAHLAVHLVHERDDRRRAEPADLQQLDRLRLDALRGVDHHHRGIDGGQHAIGVFGEVLVAGRVEQVDRVAFVVELHHGARHRYPALLLHFHPVRGGVTPALARLDGAGHLDRAAVEQQLLRQRRLAGVRVRDDRERPALRYVAHEVGGKGGFFHRFGAGSATDCAPASAKNKRRRPVAAGGETVSDYTQCAGSP